MAAGRIPRQALDRADVLLQGMVEVELVVFRDVRLHRVDEQLRERLPVLVELGPPAARR